jgi:hypothetical protein
MMSPRVGRDLRDTAEFLQAEHSRIRWTGHAADTRMEAMGAAHPVIGADGGGI